MKIKQGFVLKSIADSHIVVPLGSQVVDFSSIIKLTDTGAFLWSKLSSDVSSDELVSALTAEYDVDIATATRDVSAFITKLRDADLLE